MLNSRRVVVTGAGRGLGLAISKACAMAGAEVTMVDLAADRVQTAAEALAADGLDVVARCADISDATSVDQLVNDLPGDIWGLVNNAAKADAVGGKLFWEIEPGDWDGLMAVNVTGSWLMSRAVAPRLRSAGQGRIVNLASDAALYGSPRLSHYVTSKGAVIAMTRAMARDIGPDGVTVNAVAPGIVLTESTEGVPEQRHRLYAENRALDRKQTPDDVVGAVTFLLSDAASYITGHTLVVDGGFVMA